MTRGLRLRAWLWSATAALALAVCVTFMMRGAPVQTNLLALLPPTERDPVVEQAVEALNAAVGQRVLFMVSHPDGAMARAAAADFAVDLERAGLRQVTARVPPLDPRIPLDLYGPHRFGLLTDTDREVLAQGRFDPGPAVLQHLLNPLSAALATPPETDPFGFLSHWLSTRMATGGTLSLEDGFLVARKDGWLHVLIMAELAGSPFASDQQDLAERAFSAADAGLQVRYPEARVIRTGTVFYAAAARSQAQSDVDRIGLGSLLGIALLLYLVFRSAWPLALGLLSVAIGVTAASSVVLLTQGELHLITLAFGASLIGEAIDYSIQYFATHQDAGTCWHPERGLEAVRPALMAALATSLLSYGLLGLLPFPAISQIALFAFTGLTAAYLSVIWLLPALLTRPSRRDPETATRWAARLLDAWCSLISGRRAMLLAGLVLLCSIPGWYALEADDDVRLLISRPARLAQEEAAIRRLAGFETGGRFFLVRGASAEEVLERESALIQRLKALQENGSIAGYQAITDFVPPRSRQEADRALFAHTVLADPPRLSAAFSAVGFRPELARTLARDHAESAVLQVGDWLRSPVSVPWRHLWNPVGEQHPASIVLVQTPLASASLVEAAAGLTNVHLVDKAGSTSTLLGQYRSWGGPALAVLAGIIFLVLALRYGARAAMRLMTPVVLAEVLSVGVFGYAREAVTLFAILGWGLTLGIGVNYAIFLREGAGRAPAVTAGVILSAATTLLAFGLLALSGMPALRQFGLALLTGIATAVILAPLALDEGQRP